MTCDHSSVGQDPNEVVLYPCCHRYFRGDKELTSITKLLKASWPDKPDFSSAPEGVIENARKRGVEVDQLFSRYLAGTLTEIPVDTRQDSADLFMKLAAWWDGEPSSGARAQVVLADDELAGTADIVTDAGVYDLKTTYNLEPTYSLQVGGYCHLYESTYGKLPSMCGIIHLAKRFDGPKFVPFDVLTVVSEFRVVLDMWRLYQRKRRVRG